MQLQIPLLLFRHLLRWRSRHLPSSLKESMNRIGSFTFGASEETNLSRILDIRRSLRSDPTRLIVQDYGAGSRSLKPGDRGNKRTIGSIFQNATVPLSWGLFLYGLVRELRPHVILELGTNLGISACYLKAAQMLNPESGDVVTIEGDPTLAGIARQNLEKLAVDHFEVCIGTFREKLPSLLDRYAPIDLVFIDGHHQSDAALMYFEMIAPYLAEQSCIVFDDIEPWTRTVRPAWNRIRQEHQEAEALDLVKFGLLFFGKRDIQ